MKIQIQSNLLKLKQVLNQVSDISYAFNRMNKEYPIDTLTDSEAEEIIGAYTRLLKDLGVALENYEQYKRD